MATFQPTKKKKETASDVFQPTSRKSYDSTVVYGWEQTNKQALDIINSYNNRINKSEWLDKEDRKKYRSALDSYIETANLLRGINKTFGEGYSDEDEQKWTDSIASMNQAYDSTEKYYSQWIDEKDYKGQRNGWFQESNQFDDGYQFGDVTKTVVASATDLVEGLGAGVIGMGEMALDALATLGPYFAQGQYYSNGGGYNIQADQAFDQSINASKEWTKDFVKKDLYDEQEVADLIVSGLLPVEAFTGINPETDSVFGAKSDSLAQSAGQLAGTAALQAAGVPWWVTTGATALGGESENALRQGATLDQAAFSGLVSAGAEILTEKLADGISFGAKTLTDYFPKLDISNLTSKISNKVVRNLVDLGADMVGEGTEEILSGLMSAIGQKLSYASDKEWSELLSSEDALDAFIGGAVLGFVGGTAGKRVAENKQAREIYGNGAELVTEALDIDPNNAFAQKMQGKIDKGKSLSGGQINRLVEANESALVSQDKGKIKVAVESRLTELGERGDISKLADVIVKAQSGGKLTKAEQTILTESKYGRRVSTELNPQSIESGEYTSKWAENIGTERINTEAYNRAVEAYSGDTEATLATENTPVKENATESEISAPVGDAKQTVAKATMVDNEGNEVEAKVAKIVDVENGEASLELEGGQTVKASDVDFGDSGIGLVYKAATEMVSGVGGFNVDAANVMVKGFNPNGSIQAAGAYVSGFNEAYRYGAMGYPVSALATGNVTSKLSVAQREVAYNLGKAYGNEKVAEKQAKIDSTVSIKAGKDSGKATKKGKVYFDGSAVGKTLTERQRASLKGLRVIAEAMGIDIYIFESKVGKDGKRQGANGWYDPSDNSIHLDLHAGVDGNGLMLYTAAHELAHYMRAMSPAKFKIFADALLDEYTKNGVSLDELISRKLETLEANKRLEGKTKEEAYDLAYEEVVADASEAMLVDSDAIEALSRKIQAKDKGLWETIKDFFTKLVARIKAAYEGIDPDSREGKLVREMTTSAERLRKLWVDALLEASEVSTEMALGESGIIVNSKTDSASLMSVRDVLTDADRKKVSKTLAERFGVTQAEAMDWLKAETSLASLILNPKYSQYLDYTGDPNEEAIKSNSDYPQGTVDFSNICKKRRDFTEVMNRVLRNFPNHVFAATDLAKIRTIMEQEGMEVACAICYVEDRRQLDGPVAQDFIDSLAIYREGGKNRPDGKPFNANQLKAFKLIEGDTYTPSIYELISLKGRNSLKAKNPAMEEAWVKFNNARGMQSVRLLLNDAEYKRQILKYSPSVVKRKNDYGGLRIYSFSDMEMFHLIDIIQVITDSATVGLSLQGYTKVNEYAKAVKDTGEKLNRSLIPKGDLGYHIENGRVVLDFDTTEGIDINHPDFFDNIDNPNIGNIVIGINATQIKAAMTSKFIDQIIPFHTGQSGEVLGEKGIAAWENYKDFQSERDASTKKKSSHQINIYTEVINAAEAEGHPITNKVEFVNKFLEVCKENNLIPRFSDFLNVDENGDYVYTEGYHKFLVDFKTFDQNTGEYLPQMPVKPIFDNEYITKLLTDYVKTQQAKDAEFTKAMPKVLDRITKEIVNADGVKYSDRDSEGNTLSKEQQEFFKDSQVRWGNSLMPVYHGTRREFTVFDATKGYDDNRVGGLLWAAKDYEYAKDYSYSDEPIVMKGYLNITKLLDIGDIDSYANYESRLQEIADLVKLTPSELEAMPQYDDRVRFIYDITSSKAFRDRIVELGYDGVEAQESGLQTFGFVDSSQFKETSNKKPTSNPDIRYQDRNPYSYEALTSKPDMKLTTINNVVQYKPTKSMRQNAVNTAIKNAKAVGKTNSTGGVMVYVDDTGTDVILSRKSLEHGLDRRFSENLPATLKAGEILKNAVRVNELTPKIKTAKAAYVLIGAAKSQNGDFTIVEFVVNEFTNEVDSIEVLKSVNTKKEAAVLNAPPPTNNSLRITASDISIAQLLEFVNSNFPDVLSESVLRHYGHTERPRGELGENALYQDRNPDSYSNRSLLAGALETAVQNDVEREKLRQYKQKIDLINSEEQKLHELREQIKELSFKKGPRDTQAIKNLQFEANQAANRINTYDKQLLNLESTKALKGVLEREKALARKRDAQKYKESLERYREKSAKAQRELMDRYQESRKRGIEGRNKTAMRHKIKDVVNELNNYLLKGTKDKHVPIELQRAVAEALDAVNMDTVGAEQRIAKLKTDLMRAKTPEEAQEIAKTIEHIEEMGGNMAKKIARLKTAYDSIINSDDPLVANSHDEVISNTIQRVGEVVGETPLRDMSLHQLEEVYDMYRMVLFTIRNANKAFKAKKSEEISVIANRVMEEVDALGKRKNLQSKAGEAISSFDWNNQKPIYAFKRIGSDTFTEVFNNVRAGEDAWAQDMTEAQEYRKDQYKKHNYDAWDFGKKYAFTSSSGMKFELNLPQIMSLYAYSKRDQAAEHLKRGGIVFDEATEVTVKNKLGIPVKFNPTEATAYNISEETLADIISKLTAEQKAFVDEMQDYLSTTMGEKGNEVSLELYGVKLFKEKHYFPLKSATQYMAKAKEQQKGEVKIKNSGFTKETVYKANNPIVLTPFMDVWAGHVNEMSMYHAFTLALEDFYRVYNYKTPTSETMATESVEMFLQNAHSKAATKYIDQLLKDLNGGARSDSRETFAKSLMSNFKKSSVIASLSVVIQQPSAIVRAQALVNAKYFVGKPSGKKHSEAWAEVKKYAPVAVIKEMGYFDVGMGQSSVEWLKGEKTFMDKVDDVLSKAPALADEYTWVAIWNAVKRETAHNNPTLKTSSDEFLKLCGERFTEVIVKTQVYDSTLARSANMRSKSAFMSMLTAFMAEPTTSINMLQDAFKKGNKKQIARTLGAVYGSVVLNAALVSLVYAMRDDDEDETFLEKYLSRLTTEVIDGINPLTYVPFVKDIWSALQGYDIERADMTLLTKTIDSLQQLVKVASKDTSDMDEKERAEHNKAVNEAILSIADNLSSLTGVPVKNIRRDINGIINGIKTIKTDIEGRETTAGSLGDNILEDVKDSVPVWGWLPDESKGDKLYDAIINGDEAYAERLKSGYKSETAIDSAIRKALRENDPRIKEAAEAYLAGDYATYNSLRAEIVAEGIFSNQLVTDALKAEVNLLKKKANED